MWARPSSAGCFFGRDNLSFSAHSTDSGTTRHSPRAMAELNEARIWAGVHYRFAAKNGHRLGTAVARDVFDHAFDS